MALAWISSEYIFALPVHLVQCPLFDPQNKSSQLVICIILSKNKCKYINIQYIHLSAVQDSLNGVLVHFSIFPFNCICCTTLSITPALLCTDRAPNQRVYVQSEFIGDPRHIAFITNTKSREENPLRGCPYIT